jgi:dihydropteroate synthase/2-amino-4-hydroxy-6-hydroxymethyldihydropteridine diphosphokinase
MFRFVSTISRINQRRDPFGISKPLLTRGGGSSSYFSSGTGRHRVYVAVGSNLGNRFDNIVDGIDLLCKSSSDEIKLVRTSSLIESAPMYVTDQPAFLNGVVELETTLPPKDLLRRIKEVERDLGRNFSGIRNGPRPIDLDICFYGVDQNQSLVFRDDELEIPHARLSEREFVLAPLIDLGASELIHPKLNITLLELFEQLKQRTKLETVRVLPLPRGRMLYLNDTIVMGILNVTPDSFSDGGNYRNQVELAVNQALEMVEQGAGIIDVGGESTRPGAKEVEIDEELRRTIPVIQEIRKCKWLLQRRTHLCRLYLFSLYSLYSGSDVPLSIDTRHALVAKAAVEAGADVVNDVSGGTFDENMLSTVAELRVPMIIMHMRGTPETMQNLTSYDSVVDEVAAELRARTAEAERCGIQRWLQVLDPGIGFAKDLNGNLQLLKYYGKLQMLVGHLPMLLGTSRKGFIGKVTGETHAAHRDFGSVASTIAAICLGGSSCRFNILRVHNVKGAKQAAMVMDAIRTVED